MEPPVERELDHRGRKDIYEYVESHGNVREREVRATLGMDAREFGHHVNILRRDGILTETEEGYLQITHADTDETEHDSGDLTYTIRQARQSDITGLVGVMREAIDEEYVVAESVADMLDHEEVLLRRNEVESRMFFVACVDGDVVGWVHLEHPEMEKLRHTAELTVGVLDGYRGHGIGRSLLDRGLDWGREQGHEKVYNSVPSTNDDAIDFLEAHGWEIEARREDHYKIGDDYVDEVMMGITL